jgi:hypothetical protein
MSDRLAPIAITKKQREFLKETARESGHSISTIIRLLIDAEIKKNEAGNGRA